MRKPETVTGSLAVVVPVVPNSDAPRKVRNELLRELESQFSRVFLLLPWPQSAQVRAERLTSSQSYAPCAKLKGAPKTGRARLLKVSVQIDAPADAICVWGDDKFPVGREPRHALCAAAETLFDRVALMSVACQLAAPGYAHFPKPRGFINDEPWGIGTSISWILHEARYASTRHGWPVISRLPIEQVDSWLCRVPGVVDGMGIGRTGRGVAALSRILCSSPNDSSEMGIAWAVLGLEALYADGNQGLSQQILRKSEILLGPRDPKKQQLKNVYDYRSRFLHGSIDMPLAYADQKFDPPDKGKFMTDTYEYWSIGTCMLIATLQQMILRDIIELTFSLRLDDPGQGEKQRRSLQLLS